jgi:hypothetical protein
VRRTSRKHPAESDDYEFMALPLLIDTEKTEVLKYFEGDLGVAVETLDALVPNIGHKENDPTYWGEDDVE